MNQMAASEFKAKCLRVLDEVERTGESVIILKRGKPVAELVPFVKIHGERFPQDALDGSAESIGDIVGPPLPEDAWEAFGTDS